MSLKDHRVNLFQGYGPNASARLIPSTSSPAPRELLGQQTLLLVGQARALRRGGAQPFCRGCTKARGMQPARAQAAACARRARLHFTSSTARIIAPTQPLSATARNSIDSGPTRLRRSWRLSRQLGAGYVTPSSSPSLMSRVHTAKMRRAEQARTTRSSPAPRRSSSYGFNIRQCILRVCRSSQSSTVHGHRRVGPGRDPSTRPYPRSLGLNEPSDGVRCDGAFLMVEWSLLSAARRPRRPSLVSTFPSRRSHLALPSPARTRASRSSSTSTRRFQRAGHNRTSLALPSQARDVASPLSARSRTSWQYCLPVSLHD